MSHKRAAYGPPTPPKVSQRSTRAGAGARLAGAFPQQVSEDDDVHDHHRWHVEDGEVIGDAEIRWIHVILEGGDVRVDQVEQPDDIERGRGADGVVVQYRRAARPDLREHLHLQGSRGSNVSRRLLLPRRPQRASDGGRARHHLRLLAEGKRQPNGRPPRHASSAVRPLEESADRMRLSYGTSNREIKETQPMNRMRISLFYLGSYLAIIGFGLLFVPHETLKILQSNGDYDDVFPRVAGMLMSGLGLSIFGIIRARALELYPATLFIRVYFIACIAAFYAMTGDPLFLVLIVIVGLGFVLTLGSYLLDRKSSR